MTISSSPVAQTTYTGTGGTGTTAITLGSTPVSGNLLINCMGVSSTTVHISSVAETNATWAVTVDAYSHARVSAEIWHGRAAGSASTTVTNTYSANLPGASRGNISEWSGIDTTNPLQTSGIADGSSTTPTTASVTPIAGRECLLLAMCRCAGAFSSLDTAGWTALTTPSTGTQFAYMIVANPSGSYNCSWTFGSAMWDASIAVYNGYARMPHALFQSTHR